MDAETRQSATKIDLSNELSQSTDPNRIPTSYDEFVHLYYPRITRQVRSFAGIRPGDVEDITQIIVMQFIEKDYLNIYDHGKQAMIAEQRNQENQAKFEAGDLVYEPAKLKGKFTSFLYEFVLRRLMGLRDKSNRLFIKEGTSVQQLLEAQDEPGDSHISVPVAFTKALGVVDNEYFSIELRQVLKKCHEMLVARTSPTPTRDFPRLFQTMVVETFTNEDGSFDKKNYADQLGITVSAVSMQIKSLREHITAWGLDDQLHELFVKRSRSVGKMAFL